jgi:energy-coupling factor transporter ATP-binding protein EcfA2
MTNFGARPGEWDALSALGLESDLLPVVSNPSAKISAQSTMKQLGKTPSRYNGAHEAVGIAEWTEKFTSPSDIARWKQEPDYGICLQTREVRAIDVDVEDEDAVIDILLAIGGELDMNLPIRSRANSSKCLLPFRMKGELTKRVLRLGEGRGIIELLATGQQFIASGVHPSGVRYEWQHRGKKGLPTEIPELTLEQVNALWGKLASQFAVAQSEAKATTKAQVLHEAINSDPVAQYLVENDWVKSTERDGRLHIRCPFEAEHTCESADSSTTYFPAHTGGYVNGHFDCKHGHCEHRTDDEFRSELGIPTVDAFAEFDDLDAVPAPEPVQGVAAEFDALPEESKAEKPARFQVIPAAQFAQSKPMEWIVKGLLPKAEVGVLYGDSGSGKTFLALDLSGAIARGLDWRGMRTKQGKCAYVCAEGAGGMRGRLKAYAQHSGLALENLPIGVIPDAPNLTQVQDVKDLIRAIKAFGDVSVVVVDTFAQVMAGANENSGEDVGKALAHCRQIHKHTGALVLLVHHSGKNSDKGARGWSGLRAAADVEIEVQRHDDARMAKVTKMKDGADGAEFGFKLVDVPIGIDEDGDVISSCVVEEAEIVHIVKAEKHDVVESRIIRAVEEQVGMTGSDVDASLIVENVVESLLPPADGKKDTRREKVMKAVMALQEAGRVCVNKGKLSLPKDEGADDG